MHLQMVHARVDAIEDFGEHSVLSQRPGPGLLCAVIVGHPLQDPGIGIVMAGDFEVDEHAAFNECGAMLQSFLARPRRNPKRCEAEALWHE